MLSIRMKTIGGRIKEERLRLGMTQEKMAELCGVGRQAQLRYESDERSPDGYYFEAIAKVGGNIEYILTGRCSSSVKEDHPKYSVPDYVEIAHYNVQAAAGSGAIPISEELLQPLAFRRDWLVKRHLSPNDLVIVDVKGESMEPKLLNGDLVLVDKSQTDIASGKTFVLRMDGHILVKNLQLLPHGLVQVASFNTGYPAYQVDLSDESLDMAVIGRVVASMHEW
ncbi:XRE family transcriptional regulator [Methylosoma difficile]